MGAPELSAAGPTGVQTPKSSALLLGNPEEWSQVHEELAGMNPPYSLFPLLKYLQDVLGIKKGNRSSPPAQ